jgi:hypothetical protein
MEDNSHLGNLSNSVLQLNSGKKAKEFTIAEIDLTMKSFDNLHKTANTLKSQNLKNLTGGEALLSDSSIKTAHQVAMESETRYNCITQENEVLKRRIGVNMFATQDDRGMNSAFRKSYQALKSSHSKAFGIEKGQFVDSVDKQIILTKFLRSPEKYIPKER